MLEISKQEENRYAELQVMALDFARDGNAVALAPMLGAGLSANLEDEKRQSLLMLAAYHGNVEVVSLLLEHGADIDRRNARGQTSLGGAAFKGNLEVVKVLVKAGADISADNGGGMTAMSFASMFGREKVVAYLKGHGDAQVSEDKLLSVPSNSVSAQGGKVE